MEYKTRKNNSSEKRMTRKQDRNTTFRHNQGLKKKKK